MGFRHVATCVARGCRGGTHPGSLGPAGAFAGRPERRRRVFGVRERQVRIRVQSMHRRRFYEVARAILLKTKGFKCGLTLGGS